MHRTSFAHRSLACKILLSCALGACTRSASAQVPDRQPIPSGVAVRELPDPKDVRPAGKEPEPYILVLQKDSTRPIEMSTKELIAEARSENPGIAKVQALLDNPRAVLVTGLRAGTTRIYITDAKKNTESFEVRVPIDEDADRESRRRELLEQIRKAVPTARIDVVVSGNNTVILTGNVYQAETVTPILELARGVFGTAANIVNSLRIGGVQQVQIEVTIARVNRSRARNIGFSWLNSGNQHFIASTVGGGGSLTTAATLPSVLQPLASLASTPNVAFGIFNDKQSFFGYLNALTIEGLAKLISEPRVITMSGKPAWIVSGGETPILTSSGTGAPSVSYKPFGTIVNILPIVLGDGKIYLEVRPEISSQNDAAGISVTSGLGTTKVPGFDLRSAQVAVEIEDGQTLAIGGLIQNTINAQNTKVPIVGDIPFLAFAFTNKTYTELEEELIILVTPRLVNPMACCQLPKYLPGRETRTADDFELFLEGILEAPRGQRNLTHPYKAAYLNGPSSAAYPCGDTSGLRNRQPAAAGDLGGCTTGGCGPVSGALQQTSPPVVPVPQENRGPAQTNGGTPGSASIPTALPASERGSASDVGSGSATFGPAVMTGPR